VPEPAPEPEPEPEPPAPEILPEEIIPVAPTILASPDAPTTREEIAKAVPQEQSDPFLDLLKRDTESTTRDPDLLPDLSGPTAGGGNTGPVGSVNTPPGGGTRRSGPAIGAGGWNLGPQPTSPGAGFEGINLDMRCREAGRTHLDCPEYLRQFKGRDANGFESTRGLAGTGTDRGPGVGGTSRTISSRGDLGLPIGDNSVNGGGPSENFIDNRELNFGNDFLGQEVRGYTPPNGTTIPFGGPAPEKPKPDWMLEPDLLPTEEEEDAKPKTDWLLKPQE
jgi:hypothetical protein